MNDRKLIGEWKGKLTINGTLKERKIQIFKVKNQKNKIVFPGFRGPEEGTLLAIKRKKPTLLGGPNGNLEFVFVTYSARGSHQGGPMHTYNKHVAFASKDEKILESLMKFLQKHITKGKVRRTIKRGGGKKHYGIRGNNVIELYPHRIPRSIGRHKYIISWKTTKENLPNKTFHGKFYKSKEEAKEHTKSKRKKK
tara:strand:- start:2505 stop:3089 length:585 start_codon:yes stop_codon:yes gene_type:complete